MISGHGSCRIVYGVDFSGAKDAGKKIWIARGTIEENALSITDCLQAQDLRDSGRDRTQGLKALREFIGERKDSIFGLDFPFGIPEGLVKEENWGEWVSTFQVKYSSPEEFRELCTSASGGKELKRFTDLKAKTPFSPYNLRLYRQTYYGIRDVLAPLIETNTVCVLPMQRPLPDRAWVIEICPASTLKWLHLRLPYKGGHERHRAARAMVIERIEKSGALTFTKSALRATVLDDRSGDAIDSVIAAFAILRAFGNGFVFDEDSSSAVEGWVYV